MSELSKKFYTGAPDQFRTSAHRKTDAKLEKPYLNVFITYAHEDKKKKDELQKRLAVMKQQNELVAWEGQVNSYQGTEHARKTFSKRLLIRTCFSTSSLLRVLTQKTATRNSRQHQSETLQLFLLSLKIVIG